MRRDDRLQPPVVVPDDSVRINFAEVVDTETEAAIDAWLRSLLDSPGTPEEGRRS